MSLWERFLDLVYPPRCPFCEKILEHPGLCPVCEKTLPYTGEKAMRQLEKDLPCACALWYEGSVREGLLRFKFQGSRTAARPMGRLLAQCAAEELSGEFDIVTWVPVSRKRKRKRGFDQAELLAREACRVWETEPVQLLEKIVDNPAQSGLQDDAARRANVLGVYDPMNEEQIRDRHILLVDDICTTGSTLMECARVLRDAGAASVVCAAVAAARGKEKVSCGGNTQENGTNAR